MANELKIRTGLWLTKGNVKETIAETDKYITVSGDHVVHQTQEIGFAAAEALNVGEITTVGWAYFRNLDSTNFVEIGYDDSGFKDLLKLKAGEWCICRLSQNAPYAKADTAAVDLEYIRIED